MVPFDSLPACQTESEQISLFAELAARVALLELFSAKIRKIINVYFWFSSHFYLLPVRLSGWALQSSLCIRVHSSESRLIETASKFILSEFLTFSKRAPSSKGNSSFLSFESELSVRIVYSGCLFEQTIQFVCLAWAVLEQNLVRPKSCTSLNPFRRFRILNDSNRFDSLWITVTSMSRLWIKGHTHRNLIW